jgi:tRNA modification GTPase
MQSLQQGMPVDFLTIDIRDALLSLGEVTGAEVGEQVLDTVFSRFCIGK